MPNLTISDFLRAQERPIKEIVAAIRKLERDLDTLLHANCGHDGELLPTSALAICKEKLEEARVPLEIERLQRHRPTFEKEYGDG